MPLQRRCPHPCVIARPSAREPPGLRGPRRLDPPANCRPSLHAGVARQVLIFHRRRLDGGCRSGPGLVRKFAGDISPPRAASTGTPFWDRRNSNICIAAVPFCNLRLQSDMPKDRATPKQVASIGDAIRKRRLDLGLFQAEVATGLGCNKMTVAKWELGHSTPQIAHFRQIVEFLGYRSLLGRNNHRRTTDQFPKSPRHQPKDFATQLAIDQGTLAHYERGKREPSGSILARIDAILRVDELPLSAFAHAQTKSLIPEEYPSNSRLGSI